MKHSFIHIATAVSLLVASQVASAQATPGAAAETPAKASTSTSTSTNTSMADGEVRKVDKENKKITLKHGVIKNLDMPGMTMVFQVKDASLLDKIKAGDKVRFTADNLGGGITVLSIEPLP